MTGLRLHSWFLVCIASAALRLSAATTHEIRYSSVHASEVYLVWGINNWMLPPESLRGPDSFVKDNLVYTPLYKLSEGLFSAKLDLPPGTTIDYVFWVTKGPFALGTDLWDLNGKTGKDYHDVVSGDDVVLVESAIRVRPYKAFNILDYSPWLLGVCALLAGVVFFARSRRSLSLTRSRAVVICAIAVATLMGMMLLRPSVLGIGWDLVLEPVDHASDFFAGTFYDTLFVFCLFVPFLLLNFLTARHSRAQLGGLVLFAVICFSSLVFSALNIRIVAMLGKPLNYQWLYYSDFLKSADAKAAISANTSAGEWLSLGCFILAAGFMVFVSYRLLMMYQSIRFSSRVKAALPVFIVLVYFTLAPLLLKEKNWSYDLLANPVTAFAESVNPLKADPGLFSMEVADSLRFRPSKGPVAQGHNGRIKNVLVFVLESTPAEYVEPYSAGFRVTPNIRALSGNAMVFRNVYAHAPATNLSMVSLLGSVYPPLSYLSVTEEHPDIPITSISQVLKAQGYRTAFFNSADNGFQRAGEFLSYRDFDQVRDCTSGQCVTGFNADDGSWQHMGGKDDACTAQELGDWIAADTVRPFFSVMWTYQTHYPYFFSGSERRYSDDPSLNRYLNALHHADSVIGGVVQRLRQTGQLESTVVAIVGDHGEAFGRHNQVTHARELYEENVHVPCILYNPSFQKQEFTGVGGLVDVSPTLVGLVGIPPPESWQGSSLMAKNDNSAVFFFAPWSDVLFGMRQGSHKYIFNATTNEQELYDLAEDPFEQHSNLAGFDQLRPVYHQKLAGWAQFVNSRVNDLLNQKKQPRLLVSKR